MLYDDVNDGQNTTYPRVVRYTSNNGGLTAVDTKKNETGTQGTDVLRMPGESMRQSHIISNITFGPDDKLYVHVGEGFEAAAARNDNRFKGKVLRINRNGTPVSDNPMYNAGDGITAKDYVYAKGLRNPFGGAWRLPSGGRPAQHFMVENGPGLDRLSMLVRGRDYLWDGTEKSMENFNVAFSASGQFEGGVDDWKPAPAPVNIEFIQRGIFNGSGFPSGKMDHAFVTLSGPTHAQGPNFAKSIQEWVFDDDGNRVGAPRELASYEGSGYASASAIAAGPDGLYFSTLYPDTNANPLAPGAKIFRIVYTG
jgi:glucose/arabinose dehydrogenase